MEKHFCCSIRSFQKFRLGFLIGCFLLFGVSAHAFDVTDIPSLYKTIGLEIGKKLDPSRPCGLKMNGEMNPSFTESDNFIAANCTPVSKDSVFSSVVAVVLSRTKRIESFNVEPSDKEKSHLRPISEFEPLLSKFSEIPLEIDSKNESMNIYRGRFSKNAFAFIVNKQSGQGHFDGLMLVGCKTLSVVDKPALAAICKK